MESFFGCLGRRTKAKWVIVSKNFFIYLKMQKIGHNCSFWVFNINELIILQRFSANIFFIYKLVSTEKNHFFLSNNILYCWFLFLFRFSGFFGARVNFSDSCHFYDSLSSTETKPSKAKKTQNTKYLWEIRTLRRNIFFVTQKKKLSVYIL